MERSGQDALCQMEMGTYIRCACESQRFRQIVSGSSLLDRGNTGVVCQDAYHACFLHLKDAVKFLIAIKNGDVAVLYKKRK